MTRINDFTGTMQTTYSDWARMLLDYHPTPKYQLDSEKNVITVISNNVDVAKFDFNTATGYIQFDGDPISPNLVGKIENFTCFDINDFIK